MSAIIPMQTIGPIKIKGPVISNEEISVPLATFETPLWPSTNRGAKVTRLIDGVNAIVVSECMTRSIVLEASSAIRAFEVSESLKLRKQELELVTTQSSSYAKLISWHSEIVGNLLYLRFKFNTGDASGHNMSTRAAEYLLNWITEVYQDLKYISISANYCVDKKNSAVNAILGRGRSVIVDGVIERNIVQDILKTTPEKIHELNIKKNLIGGCLAGSLRSANAHFGNMLLAFYLATGQDGVNVIEGSQGIVYTEVKNQNLYFAVNLPNLIIGTVGNGKDLPFVRENLAQMGCLSSISSQPGLLARRLAVLAAATVWCGELSLLAAQTNPGELMRTHVEFERNTRKH